MTKSAKASDYHWLNLNATQIIAALQYSMSRYIIYRSYDF